MSGMNDDQAADGWRDRLHAVADAALDAAAAAGWRVGSASVVLTADREGVPPLVVAVDRAGEPGDFPP